MCTIRNIKVIQKKKNNTKYKSMSIERHEEQQKWFSVEENKNLQG